MICCNYRRADFCTCYGCEVGRHCGEATSERLLVRLARRLRRRVEAWTRALDA